MSSQTMHNVGGRWIIGSAEAGDDEGWTTKWSKRSRNGKGYGRTPAALAAGPPLAMHGEAPRESYRAASYDSSDGASYEDEARPRRWRSKGKGKGKGRYADTHAAERNSKWEQCTECSHYINVAELYQPYCGCGKLLLYSQCSQRLRHRCSNWDLGADAPARGWQMATQSPETRAIQKEMWANEWWESWEPTSEQEKQVKELRCAGLEQLRQQLADKKEALKKAAETPQTLAELIQVH